MTISSVSSLLQQMQQSMFSSLDKNADGVLSQSEFDAIGQNVPASANTAASSASGAAANTSTVQATSLATTVQSFSSEILQALMSLQSDASSTTNADGLSSSTAATTLQLVDPSASTGVNANSDLSSYDPASAASSLEASYGTSGSMTQSQFESALQGLGSDSSQGSGQVGHHHHHHHMEDASSASSSTQTADSTFAAADSNGDGQLSTTELTSYLSAQQQTAEQGVAQYKATSDLISGFLSNLLSSGASAASTAAQSVMA